MLLFLLAFAVGLGHWAQLLIALPIFFAGTAIRTRLEDGLLEQQFGEIFREYRRSTPALIPGLRP
jgi:protein-S-isoprenylcysteine O-methyltransferase Ste14